MVATPLTLHSIQTRAVEVADGQAFRHERPDDELRADPFD
jgi:hypothetical protein